MIRDHGRRAILLGWVLTLLGVAAYVAAMGRAGEGADMIDAITGQGLLGWASISLLAAGVATWLAGNIACMHEAADPRSESER
jgi:hypothetical protein